MDFSEEEISAGLYRYTFIWEFSTEYYDGWARDYGIRTSKYQQVDFRNLFEGIDRTDNTSYPVITRL